MFGFQHVGNLIWAAADLLDEQFGIASDIYSATSFTELAREAAAVKRENRLGTHSTPARSHVETLLQGNAPVIAASDYVRAFPQQIASFIDARMTVLGTDGFGRPANRKGLRRFFEVDRQHIALAAIESLVNEGSLEFSMISEAIERLGIDPDVAAPWTV